MLVPTITTLGHLGYTRSQNVIPNLEDIKESTGVEAWLLVCAGQQGGLGALLRQQRGRKIELQTLGNLVLELNLSPKHVRGRPCLGEGEAVVFVVVLGLEVAGDSGLGIPNKSNLEVHARRRGGLDVKSGAVDGKVLAQEVIGGFSEVLKAEKRVRNEAGGHWGPQYLPGGWDWLRESHLDLVGRRKGCGWSRHHVRCARRPFMPGAPSRWKLARFTPRSGRTMVKYITPQELEALIKSGANDYLVVDVRDDDYRGGNIKGGINIPSEKFMHKLHQLIDDTQNVSKIIFHCALSQQR